MTKYHVPYCRTCGGRGYTEYAGIRQRCYGECNGEVELPESPAPARETDEQQPATRS